MKRLLIFAFFILASSAFCMEMEDEEQVDVVLLDENNNPVETVRTTRQSLNRFQVIKEALDESEDKKPAVHANKEPLEVLFDIARSKDEVEKNSEFENIDNIAKARSIENFIKAVVADIESDILLEVLSLADEYGFEDFGLVLQESVKKLNEFSLDSIIKFPDSNIGEILLNLWQNKNLEKINSAGCTIGWQIKQTMPSLGSSYPRRYLYWENVTSVAISADGKVLAAASKGKSIRIWVLGENGQFELKQELDVDAGPIVSLAMSEEGRTVVAGYGNNIKSWALNDQNIYVDKQTIEFSNVVTSLGLSGDGRTLAVGYQPNIKVFVMRESGSYSEVDNIGGNLVAISLNGKKIVASDFLGSTNILKLQDNGRWKIVSSFDSNWSAGISSSGDGHIILDNDSNKGKIRIIKQENGDNYSNNILPSDDWERISKISANGKVIVSSTDFGDKKKFNAWSIGVGGAFYPVPVFSEQSDNVMSVAVSGDGKTAISDSHSGQVAVWEFVEEDCRLTLPIAYAISKDQLSDDEKERLKSEIDFGNLHSGIAAHLRDNGVSTIRPREE